MQPIQRKALIISGASFILGAVLIHHYLKALERQAAGGERVSVLVAVRDVAAGAALTEADLSVRDVPESCVDERRVQAKERKSVLGVPLTGPLSAGSGLLWSDLVASSGSGRRLSSLVTEGKRVIHVSTKGSSFDGLLQPGDRVDVLLTTNDGNATTTTPLLENLLVLSVGGALASEDPAPRRGSVGGEAVGLSVSASEALMLTSAETRGRLRLVLRNPSDVEMQAPSPSETTSAEKQPRAKAEPNRGIEHVR
jgi:pilus assembly protein CpaB